MTLLAVNGLTKRFRGLVALDNVSFEVQRGEVVGLVGPNGAGKSTCFNCATGFVKPSSGTVVFDGRDVTGMPSHEIARLGMVRSFQQSSAFMELSVEENLRSASYLHSEATILSSIFKGRKFEANESAIAEAARRTARRVGLGAHLSSRAADLSYGHLRKLGIGIALTSGPKCLMLDEPGAGLNATESKELSSLIGELRDEGVGVVIVEHDMKLIMNLCDRVVVLNYGKKLADGTPAVVRRDPEVIRSYLGTRRSKEPAEC